MKGKRGLGRGRIIGTSRFSEGVAAWKERYRWHRRYNSHQTIWFTRTCLISFFAWSECYENVESGGYCTWFCDERGHGDEA